MLRRHLISILGELRLDEITEQKVAAVRKPLAARNASMVNLIIRMLQTILPAASRPAQVSVDGPDMNHQPEQRQRNWYSLADYDSLGTSPATLDPVSSAVMLLGGDPGLRWKDGRAVLETSTSSPTAGSTCGGVSDGRPIAIHPMRSSSASRHVQTSG